MSEIDRTAENTFRATGHEFDNEDRMRSVVHHIPDGIITIDDHGIVTTFNPGAERIFRFAAQEVIGQNITMLMAEPYHSMPSGDIEHFIRSGEAKVIGIGREIVGRRKDGSDFPMDFTISEFHIGQARCFTGIVRDITHRKLAEEHLRQSEERLRELTKYVRQVLWVIDAKRAKALYVSPGYEQMWGRTTQSLIDNPESYLEGIHPSDRDRMDRENAAMLKTGHIDTECRLLRPDGSVVWVWIMGYPVLEMGQIVRLVGVVEDITVRKRMELERDVALSRLQLHIERLPLAYVQFDSDFYITDWNSSAERIFGYAKDEILGKGPPFEDIIPPSVWAEVEAVFSRIRSGEKHANLSNLNLTKDGRTITCEWFNTPLLDDDGTFTGVLSLAQDVTERKVLEAELLQAQKMEVLGQFSGGIAHDFNNLLAVLLSCSQLLGYDDKLSDTSRQLVDDIYKAATRAASLTRKLLAFSRKHEVPPTTLNLNEIVTESIRLLDRVIGSRIKVSTHLHSDLWSVRGDAGQFSQVIMNVSLNARDAMVQGGTLTFATANVDLDATSVLPHLNLKPGPHVVLSISDTGHGMDQNTATRIFEPFFTTKEKGKGTGLGLSTVVGIVRQCGGDVAVRSEVGKGTTFDVYLPKDKAADVPRHEASAPDILPRGTETVMVVDDDNTVCELVRRILEAQGYVVVQAWNAEQALLIHKHFEEPVHLLLTAVVLPRLDGRQLSDRLHAVQPDLKVLFMSGYPEDTVIRHGVIEGESHFIEKPFSYAGLAHAVRKVLDSPA